MGSFTHISIAGFLGVSSILVSSVTAGGGSSEFAVDGRELRPLS